MDRNTTDWGDDDEIEWANDGGDGPGMYTESSAREMGYITSSKKNLHLKRKKLNTFTKQHVSLGRGSHYPRIPNKGGKAPVIKSFSDYIKSDEKKLGFAGLVKSMPARTFREHLLKSGNGISKNGYNDYDESEDVEPAFGMDVDYDSGDEETWGFHDAYHHERPQYKKDRDAARNRVHEAIDAGRPHNPGYRRARKSGGFVRPYKTPERYNKKVRPYDADEVTHVKKATGVTGGGTRHPQILPESSPGRRQFYRMDDTPRKFKPRANKSAKNWRHKVGTEVYQSQIDTGHTFDRSLSDEEQRAGARNALKHLAFVKRILEDDIRHESAEMQRKSRRMDKATGITGGGKRHPRLSPDTNPGGREFNRLSQEQGFENYGRTKPLSMRVKKSDAYDEEERKEVRQKKTEEYGKDEYFAVPSLRSYPLTKNGKPSRKRVIDAWRYLQVQDNYDRLGKDAPSAARRIKEFAKKHFGINLKHS